jgi:hypothetical protein
MLKGPLVSVIVLNWNGKRFLGDCLSSLLKQAYPNYEVILIDNNSTDGSVEYVKENFAQVKILQNQRNLGFAEGNNVGIRHAKGKYAIVLNSDTKVQENFIEELVRVAESNEKIGSVGCKIVQYDGSIRYGPVFMNEKGFIVGAKSYKTYDRFVRNLANCGCASLYRKSILDKIGMYDPHFWSDWEDHDLGYRINLSGFMSVYTPKTIVFHVGGGSHKVFEHSKERYTRIIRNKLFTYFKNYETKNLVYRFTRSTCETLVRHVGSILMNELRILCKFIKQNPKSTSSLRLVERRKLYTALFKAYLLFLQNLKSIVIEREKVQRLRTVSDSYIFSLTKEPL